MTIKQLAYTTQLHLQAATGATFKRTHIYELLAASFGFNSYAALCADTVFTQHSLTSRRPAKYGEQVGGRCLDLGYSPEIGLHVARTLPKLLTEQEIGVIRITDLVAHLRYESGRDDWFDGDSEEEDDENLGRWFDRESMASPLFLDSLTSIADGKLAVAHYALALLYAPSEDEFDAPSVGSNYWYNEAKKGRVLMGIEKEWADAHAARLEHGQKYEQHLRKAGELGYADALLELAERFGDQRFFDQPGVEVPKADPARIAEIAKQLRRPKDARYWLAEAAKQGDTEAMRELIERYDSDDLQQCWTWLYLAKLLDSDLSRDEYHAYHENGDLYDDDVGGPLYVDGRDGIKLEPIDALQDAAAHRAADLMYSAIEKQDDD